MSTEIAIEAIAQSIYSGWIPIEIAWWIFPVRELWLRLPGRVNLHFPMGFPMFSHFPMFSYGFSYCDWKSPLGITAVYLSEDIVPSDRSKPPLGIGTSHHRFCEFQIPQDQWCTPWKNADFYVPTKICLWEQDHATKPPFVDHFHKTMALPHLSVCLPEGPGLPEVEDFIAAVRKSYPSPENPRDVLPSWIMVKNG